MAERQTCPTCKGRRRIWLGGGDFLECPTCADARRCGTCGGPGQIMMVTGKLVTCPDCEGKGVLPARRIYGFVTATLKKVEAA